MNKHHELSLFIFRRDLRLEDNTGLIAALQQSKQVVPCFIVDPRQVEDTNHYKSSNALQFMIESLQDLEKQLKKRHGKLYIFYGMPEQIVENIIQQISISAVYCNQDYTPFSIHRDKQIEKKCLHHDIAFNQYHDLLLNKPDDVTTSNGTPYVKFTPFYHKASIKKIAQPDHYHGGRFFSGTIAGAQSSHYKKILADKNPLIAVHGGRSNNVNILTNIHKFAHYAQQHNILSKHTTELSAALKFGTLSIREVYYTLKNALGMSNPLLRQLYWRDFFTYIAYYSPFVFGHAFQKKYEDLHWNNNQRYFNAWCAGKTGFPIVDAGMRQLNTTGFMHNRARLIVASFLTKDLHIDWRWGERYFAQQLVDYDPAVNNGNWQWVASTGADAQPYFRIFNPWLQQKKFDPECIYIKTWIPELAKVSNSTIHMWYKEYKKQQTSYPKPLINHTKESIIAKNRYKVV